ATPHSPSVPTRRSSDLEDQISACKMYAPQPGMVVYMKPDAGRYSQTSQGLIAQGEQVKEGQKMMRLPDLRKMQVNTKVHEALVRSEEHTSELQSRVDLV